MEEYEKIVNHLCWAMVLIILIASWTHYKVTKIKLETPVPLMTATEQIDLIKMVGKCYGIYGENE